MVSPQKMDTPRSDLFAGFSPELLALAAAEDDGSINITEYLGVVLKRWKLVLGIVATIVTVVAIAVFRMPNIYESSASVLPPETGSALTLGAPDPLTLLMGRGTSPTALWVGILESKAVMDRICDRLKLWPNLEPFRRRARLRRMMTADVDKKSNIITISVESPDPVLAAKIANEYVFELDHFLRDVKRSSGQRTRSFVEGRLTEAREGLRKAEDSVRDFQEKNGAVELRSQTSAILGAISAVKGQLMSKEIELRTMLAWANRDHPKVTLLQNQITSLRAQLSQLEDGQTTASGTFIPSDRLPELSLQYARLLREVAVQENVNRVLAEQYEVARIHEASDTQTVTALDIAEAPAFPIKPKRFIILLLTTFIAAAVGAAFAIWLDEREKKKGTLPPAPAATVA
ncbi:MAG: hypothetical protein HYV07_15170 [Deltaproteobacteria bacterium]|nr:hypothetical protein [Deltaproteobacteria bacterium]